jgi:ABC-2 type transport system ATP-binding protein
MELRSVAKAFSRKRVLEDINLAVPPGRVVGLLGKNGAGKTTMLKCALGLLKTDAGAARLFGEDSWDLSAEAKARIGYVPQKVELVAWMRVRQMIAYVAAFYPRWNHEFAESLRRRWELNEQDSVAQLSEGQLQKLGLILAMGHEPELLVLDEPAASLDPDARRLFLAAVIEIAADARRAVILSTHLTSDVERVATDVALLQSGSIAYFGGIDELKESVKSLWLTSPRAFPATLDVPGVLRFDSSGNEALLTVRGFDQTLVRKLESDYAASVEVRDLNLEDIFVEVHRG